MTEKEIIKNTKEFIKNTDCQLPTPKGVGLPNSLI